MKANQRDQASLTSSLLKGLVDAGKTPSRNTPEKPSIGNTPARPAALYQDAGGGYNSDFTFPQK